MTTVRTARWLKTTTALTSAFGLAVALAPNANANPTGGQVAAGEATISAPDTRTLQIDQTSRNAVIEWRSFNIDAGETTRFVQPDNQSWTLNRVTGETAPSHILGTLEANGNVAIVNPDGILFGRDARVDVGGLIATTHDIENDDFMAGRFQFTRPGNPSASVANEGSISIADYGLGAFVAPGVRNSGVITARLGSVSLASGNAFSLDLYGDNLVHLLVDDEIAAEVVDVATGKPVTDLVKNEGRISADGGTVALTAATARRAVNSVVNNSGIIEANSVGRRGGKIVLGAQTAATNKSGAPTQRVKVSGQLIAMNVPTPTPRPDPATGGHIAILGEHIEVANATIDVSGEGGGGTVLIGGDVMGGHGDPATIEAYGIDLEAEAVGTASSVAIDKDTVIVADALEGGDGGKVVVWADRDTTMDGAIQARGGATGGDGGFVEVSGRERLAFSGSVDTDAPDGQGGTLLLDPANATIGTIGTWIITPASIAAALASGNVIVTTGNQGEGDGDLTVAQAINWSTANSLTLKAHRDINVNASISNSGGADVSLRADGTGSGVGTVTFAPGTQVSTAGTVSLFYNPSVNPTGSSVNSTSYVNPTEDFSAYLNGGENSVYMLVNSVNDLQNMQNYLGGSYALGRDIDAAETAIWNNAEGFIPIGDENNAFNGIFLGSGHTIENLVISRSTAYVGLFGYIGITGVVDDVGLRGGSIGGGRVTGGIAGMNQGTILNTYSMANVQSGDDTGGLVGSNYYTGKIYESYTTGNVTGRQGVGGLVGYNGGGVVERSFATGDVYGVRYVGGLVGVAGNSIRESYATGNVSGLSHLGGLAGFSDAHITDSYATGDVTGVNGHPGDVPMSASEINSNVGGLVGLNAGAIDRSYATGIVVGGTGVGGLVGYNTGSLVTSFYDNQTTGQQVACGFTDGACSADGLSTGDMKTAPTFADAGWDFNAVWDIDPTINDGYPYLRWQTASFPLQTILTPTFNGPEDPPPNPDPIVLTVDPFPASFSTATSPFQPTITVTGTGFSSVTEIRWSWTDPNGITGTATWNAGNNWGNGRVQLVSDTSAVLTPVLVATGDPQGTYQWDVAVVAGGQEVTRSFTVSYQQIIPPNTTVAVASQALLNPNLQLESGEEDLGNSSDPPADELQHGLTPGLQSLVDDLMDIYLYRKDILNIIANNAEYAKLATIVYDDLEEGQRYGEWTVVRTYSRYGFAGKAYAVLFKDAVGRHVVAFRGTKGLLNWGTNLSSSSTVHTELAAEIAELLPQDLDPAQVTFVGHSLGGRMAQIARIETGGDAVVFNSAPLTAGEIATSLLAKGNLIGFRSPQDIVSGLPSLSDEIEVMNYVPYNYSWNFIGEAIISGARYDHSMANLASAMNTIRIVERLNGPF